MNTISKIGAVFRANFPLNQVKYETGQSSQKQINLQLRRIRDL